MKTSLIPLLILLLAAVGIQTAYAFPRYSQQTGKACSYCHVNPAGGKDLTAAGQYYKTNKTLEGYTPPEAAPAPTPPTPAPTPETPPAPPAETAPPPTTEAPEVTPPPPPAEAAPAPAAPPPVEEMPATPAAPETPAPAPEAAAPSTPPRTGVAGSIQELPVTGMNEVSLLMIGFGLVSAGTLLYRKRD